VGSQSDAKSLGSAGKIYKHLPGPGSPRHYASYDLVTWQPRGTLDDVLLNQIAEWITNVEKEVIPLRRYVDLRKLTMIAIRTRHLFEVARKRAEDFPGKQAVRTSLYSNDWVGFGIARLYESLMENTLIHARAFQELAPAAEWLGVPVEILELKDETGSATDRP
jgi:hypothetical protein